MSPRAAAALPGRRLTMAAVRRESKRTRRERTEQILARLRAADPKARTALAHRNPFELLVATILSAQTTDERVNLVTPALFQRFPKAGDLAEASLAELEELVHSTGFFRNKARSLKALGQALVAEHGGEVPEDMAALTALPGVGRKTANVVLGAAFGRQEGIVVDTHVQRLSHRLGLTEEQTPERIERDLMELVPRPAWSLWSNLLILHGRRTCIARAPRCGECPVAELCPSAELVEPKRRTTTRR
jgi:endonuclease-3